MSPYALIFAVVLPWPLVAADPPALKLPASVAGKVGDWIVVTAETNGQTVRWVPFSAALKLFPPQLLKDTKTAVLVANEPGQFQLLAYTAVGDVPSEPVVTTIVIGGPPPVPPVPPPGPNPPPPGPVDPLTKRVRDALAADPDAPADKAKYAAALSGFYSAMAKHVATDQVATVGDLLSDYRNAIPAVLPDGAIPTCRKQCGAEVAAACGEDSERAIDAPLKASLVALFTNLAKALEVK